MFHAAGGGKLGPRAASFFDRCERREAILYVPAVVMWECSLLARVSRINLRRTVRAFFDDLFSNPSYQPLDVTPEQIFRADELRFTRDPFDALICAAAQTIDLPLITPRCADPRIRHGQGDRGDQSAPSPTGTHGRYLIEPPAAPGPAPLLVGFHGYGEDADVQLERHAPHSGADRWRLVSIQGLHRFYQRRANEVVASWMTRQDRELAIADNLAYVAAVLDDVDREHPRDAAVGLDRLLAGRRDDVPGARPRRRAWCDGVIAVGGDVPPELGPAAARHASARPSSATAAATSGIRRRFSTATSSGCATPA